METLAIINAIGLSEHATSPWADGPSALERAVAFAERLAPGRPGADRHSRILVLASGPLPELGPRSVVRDTWTMRDVLAEADRFASAEPDCDTVIYLRGDEPFLDAGLTGRLLELHGRYRAEYTFADGYPPGFSPELLSVKTLPNLVELASRHEVKPERGDLFALIQNDINSYDIETHLSPRDMRAYRFSPVCDTRRNAQAAERLWKLGGRTAEDAIRILPGHPELLRTLPAFLWVQVSEGCAQACAYCPYPSMAGDPRGLEGFMPVERFERLMADAEALCDDLVVDLSLWGEPSAHPDFPALARAVLARPRFTLIVETSGVGWERGQAESLAAEAGSRAQWVISLDAVDDEGYLALRGAGKDEAAAFAERLIAASPGNVHVQAVRMKENEAGLEAFYRGWKQRGAKVIVQKYDPFSGCLPDRSVADLSPLDRLPCRHLARDMAVLLDGSVPWCKHCLVPGEPLGKRLGYAGFAGNAFSDGLGSAWEAMGAWYDRHIAGDLPEPCGRCDEYHTFNA
ncbi:MAG TPA: spiro-SPASM protein [Spirochaetales bacterium]|nr:spiro-SPASM protein [Spirochaetales bacterium]